MFARSQSAYRQYYSTETALLRVRDDILRSLDKPHGEVILVLLDLTAAFDTIDHALLLQRLRQHYGVGGKVLQWFESYLHQREQSILINTSKSDPLTMDWGIPQGSIGGPILFQWRTLFTLMAYRVSYMLMTHNYIFPWSRHKDLLQLRELNNVYLTSKLGWPETFLFSTIVKPRFCISLLVFLRTLSSPTSLQEKQLSILFLILVTTVLILDTHMTMRPHISNITRSASFALKKISSIRKYLDRHCLLKNSFMLPYLLALTIVIVYSSTSPIRIFANFDVSKTHLHALLLS